MARTIGTYLVYNNQLGGRWREQLLPTHTDWCTSYSKTVSRFIVRQNYDKR